MPLTIIIHSHTPCDCEHPGKQGLAGPISVSYTVDAKPHVLEHILSIGSAAPLAGEKPVELWAEGPNQNRPRGWIRLPVPPHELLPGDGGSLWSPLNKVHWTLCV